MNDTNLLKKFAASTQLLIKEAWKRGYEISLANKTDASKNFILTCKKGARNIIFNNWRTMFDSPLGVQIESDKITTYDILQRAILPTPTTLVLRRAEITKSQKAPVKAMTFLRRDASHLVVKPSNTDFGNGVSMGIADEDSLYTAIQYALEKSQTADILLQQQVSGKEYRFLVLRNRVVAVANRRPPFVVGDGVKTVHELINIENANPRRGNKHTLSPLIKISIDEVTHFLGKDELEYVPDHDKEIGLLKTSNLSRGGESIDVTDIASPKLKEMAVAAAQACQLGIAGVDIITEDIENGSTKDSFIIEVNASPGLRMHHFPSIGQPRNVAAMIFDELEKDA